MCAALVCTHVRLEELLVPQPIAPNTLDNLGQMNPARRAKHIAIPHNRHHIAIGSRRIDGQICRSHRHIDFVEFLELQGHGGAWFAIGGRGRAKR